MSERAEQLRRKPTEEMLALMRNRKHLSDSDFITDLAHLLADAERDQLRTDAVTPARFMTKVEQFLLSTIGECDVHIRGGSAHVMQWPRGKNGRGETLAEAYASLAGGCDAE